MKSLNELIEVLDATPKHMILHVAVSQLLKAHDWNQLTANYIEELPDDSFFNTVDKMHIPYVDPRVFMIHENIGRYQIVVHHFDLERFNQRMASDHIGPHFHHFSFATRILRGGYTNVLFENEGELMNPALTPTNQSRCKKGSVYSIDYRQYHCVFRPESDSMSLMIRTFPELDPGHSKEPGYTKDIILSEKKKIVKLLKAESNSVMGKLDEFEPYDAMKVIGIGI
jgi:hypothetical protein